ncbi:hypothetical protein TNCV_2463411 [Trichonephila clavipes]|nr:hypothetical protein TNCV_2463411 [Trichonephila clavipes]
MAIRNNINDLHSMKTAVWAVNLHLLSSNERPQHVLYPAIIKTWCKLQKTEAGFNERVSPNAVYKLGGEVNNTVMSQNYIGKHGWKVIGGAARRSAPYPFQEPSEKTGTGSVVCCGRPKSRYHFRLPLQSKDLEQLFIVYCRTKPYFHFMNKKFSYYSQMIIHDISHLLSGLLTKGVLSELPTDIPAPVQRTNSLVYNTPVNSEMDLVERISIVAATIRETSGICEHVRQSLCHVGIVRAYIPMAAKSNTSCYAFMS